MKLRCISCASLICVSATALAQSDPSLDTLNARVVQLFTAGRFAEGLPVAAAAVDLAEHLKGPNDPGLATALNNYGLFLVRVNRLAEAEAALQRALRIDEAAPLGARELARDLNNLAAVLQSSQRDSEAEELYRRALGIDERTLNPGHRDIARDLNNIAALLRNQGKNPDAEPLQRRAIAILENLQRENPAQSTSDLASALSNFASGMHPERREEAQALYRRALELNERSFGADHPNVAVNLNNLAESLRTSGKYEEAESLFRRALRIDERLFGPQSPTVAIVLNNLAKVLRDTSRLDEAESLFNHALTIDQANFGPIHPAVARDYKNLAKFFKVSNRSARAEPLMERAIDILQEMERRSGRPVIEIGPALTFQAQILADTNQFMKAEATYRRALALDEKNYGQNSTLVAKDLKGLADLLTATKRSEEAAPLLRRADEITAALQRPGDVKAEQSEDLPGMTDGLGGI